MRNIAFIPARCGSKGIALKNIKPICGKPLIAWTIEYANKASCVDEVFVSTDCEEVKAIAESFGAKVPFVRPKKISGDKASTESAVLHFLRWLDANFLEVENIILMQATSPFRYPLQLDKAMSQFKRENADSLLTVSKSHRFIWKNLSNPSASYDISNRPRRQDIKSEDEIFLENGSFYISKAEIYKKFENRLGGKISMFQMTPEESIEIDDLFDFHINEYLLAKYSPKL